MTEKVYVVTRSSEGDCGHDIIEAVYLDETEASKHAEATDEDYEEWVIEDRAPAKVTYWVADYPQVEHEYDQFRRRVVKRIGVTQHTTVTRDPSEYDTVKITEPAEWQALRIKVCSTKSAQHALELVEAALKERGIEPELPTLAQRLKDAREQAGLTQDEVAQKVGGTAAAISNYERGMRDPGTAMLVGLACLYGASVDYLLGLISTE